MTEQTEGAGGEVTKNSPDYLQHRQDFYKQPPFDTVLDLVSSQYTGRVEGNPTVKNMRNDLASLLTVFARTHADPMDRDERQKMLRDFFADVKDFLPTEAAKEKYDDSVVAQALKTGIIDVLEDLKHSSYWMNYVKAQLVPGGPYKVDGGYRYGGREKAPPGLPQTYLVYAKEKAQADQRLVRSTAEAQTDPYSRGLPGSRVSTGKDQYGVARPTRNKGERPKRPKNSGS